MPPLRTVEAGLAPQPAFGDLLAAISHEIRTPLTAVIGFCDLMGREIFGPVGDPRYATYLRHIAEGGAALLKSAEDTLALSACLAGNGDRDGMRDEARLDRMAADICTALQPIATPRCILISNEVPDGLAACADPASYRQAITNLVLEAIDRTRNGGRVSIAAQLDPGLITLTVKGDGGAIASARESLAMRIARALVELEGNRIAVETREDGPWQASLSLEPSTQTDLFA